MIRRLTDVSIQSTDLPEVQHTGQEPAVQQQTPQEAERRLRSDSSSASQISEMNLGATAQQALLNSHLDAERSISDRSTVSNTRPPGLLSVGNQGPEVQNLQNQLNEWRAANGKSPIIADGIFGPKTEAALKEFQQATGLNADGIAGPRTADRFRLENNPNFQRLDPEMKNIVRNNVDAYQNIPGAKDNLIDLATTDRFAGLSKDAQTSILGRFLADPSNPMHLASMKATMDDMALMENDPAFAKLDPHSQRFAKVAMAAHNMHGFGREGLIDMIRSDHFQQLRPDQQERILASITGHPAENSSDQFKGILQTKGFRKMSDVMKERVIDLACRDAGQPSKNLDLSILLADPSFVNAPEDEQWAQLKGYEGRTGLEV
jgi:peptidoglycan hydrolase-like protein with peptidoglycan-binding domain